MKEWTPPTFGRDNHMDVLMKTNYGYVVEWERKKTNKMQQLDVYF